MREVSIVTHRDFVKKKLVDVFKKMLVSSLPEKIRKNKKQNVVAV
jgi:LysR family hydrogen peroxide-inducible transcriptional activator